MTYIIQHKETKKYLESIYKGNPLTHKDRYWAQEYKELKHAERAMKILGDKAKEYIIIKND